MIALNIVLMTAAVIGLVLWLAWAIGSDRRSKRAAGGTVGPEDAPLASNLEMPRELRAAPTVRTNPRPTHARRRTARSSVG